MNKTIMKCGCSPNARTLSDGSWVASCVIHQTTEVVPAPNIENRLAKCSYGCKDSIVKSSFDLAFFSYRPDEEFDRYYCSCYGWD